MNENILITAVRIRNFRSLENVEVPLESTTILIGENNAGKTSFLDALYIALGSETLAMGQEDIFLSPDETQPPIDRMIRIDVRIQPYGVERIDTETDVPPKVLNSFDDDSPWRALFRGAILPNDHGREMISIRTEMSWNDERRGYVTERFFLNDWEDGIRIGDDYSFTAEHLESIRLFVVDAKRDIQDELLSKRSFWHRLVANPGMDTEQMMRLEGSLEQLNQEIIESSPILTHVQDELRSLYSVVSSDRESVFITPLVQHLRDLNRGMDINFKTKNAQQFPLSRHGMGTRSLASILTFRAYSTWRLRNASDTTAVHSFVAVEEPETHLHPQAQRAVYRQIQMIPGQKIVSTHSPYLVAQASIPQLQAFSQGWGYYKGYSHGQ